MLGKILKIVLKILVYQLIEGFIYFKIFWQKWFIILVKKKFGKKKMEQEKKEKEKGAKPRNTEVQANHQPPLRRTIKAQV